MTPEDRSRFAQLLTDALAFYGKDVSPFALSVWWEACKGCSLDQVAKALTAHAMDPDRGQFAPKPADLVRQLQGTHADRSLVAWGRVYDAMKAVGAYRSVDFGSPAIHQAIVDMGGWQKLCRSTTDELPFIQKRFCDAYRAYSARGELPDAPLALTGEFDQINSLNGRKTAEPVRLGAPSAPRLAGRDAA